MQSKMKRQDQNTPGFRSMGNQKPGTGVEGLAGAEGQSPAGRPGARTVHSVTGSPNKGEEASRSRQSARSNDMKNKDLGRQNDLKKKKEVCRKVLRCKLPYYYNLHFRGLQRWKKSCKTFPFFCASSFSTTMLTLLCVRSPSRRPSRPNPGRKEGLWVLSFRRKQNEVE